MMRKFGLGLVTVVAVFAFSSLGFARMGDEEWKAAQKDLASKAGAKDAKMRMLAAQKLGEADRKEACEMLLKILEYARRTKEPLLKEHDEAAEAVEKIGSGPVVIVPGVASAPSKDQQVKDTALRMRELEKLMQDEDDVRDACVEALSKTTDQAAIDWMATSAFKSNNPSDRAAVAEVMGINKWTGAAGTLEEAYGREKDPLVKLSICEALALLASKDSVDTIAKALLDPAWQVRMSAIGAMKRIGGKEPIEPLIAAFEKEKELRVRNEFAAALQHLTGVDYGKDIVTWKKWWGDNAATFNGPAPKAGGHSSGGPGQTAAFFGIPVDSDKIVFILDISGSMNDETTLSSGARTISSGPGAKRDDNDPCPSPMDCKRDPCRHAKIEVAKDQLKRCIKKLNKDVKFNIYTFNDAWSKWQDKMVVADMKNKEDAYSFTDQISANAQTNPWDPMEDAFKAAGMGLNDKHYASALDTIFLLSDGSPYPPDVYVGPDEILKRVHEMNSLKKVKINCIGIGEGQNFVLLGGLAKMTGGTYVRAETGKER